MEQDEKNRTPAGWLRNGSLARDTLFTTIWSCLGKSIGLLIPFFIAAWFGSTGRTDAFFFCYAWVIGLSLALESVIVPFIAQIRARGEDVGGFVGRILFRGNIALLIGLPLLIGGLVLFLPWITKFSPEDLKVARVLLVLIAPLIVLITNTSILAGTLNAYKRFTLPALSPAIRAVAAIVFILIFRSRLGILAVPIGYIIGDLLRLLVLRFDLKRAAIKLTRRSGLKIDDFFPTAGHQLVSIVAVSFIPIIDKTMASWLPEGSISNFSYAERLYQLPIAFLSSGLLVTLLSHWSGRVYAGGEKGNLKGSINKMIGIIGAGSVALILLLFILRGLIVGLAYGHAGLEPATLKSISLIYLILIFTLLPELVSLILTRVCIVYKQTRIMRNLGVLRLSLKVGLNLLLMYFWGIYGIALATVLTVSISLFYLWRKTITLPEIKNLTGFTGSTGYG